MRKLLVFIIVGIVLQVVPVMAGTIDLWRGVIDNEYIANRNGFTIGYAELVSKKDEKVIDTGLTFKSKTGAIYSIKNARKVVADGEPLPNTWEVCNLFEIWSKHNVSISAGWAYESEGLVSVQYNFTSLTRLDSMPISPEIGVYAGYDVIAKEMDYGLTATIIAFRY